MRQDDGERQERLHAFYTDLYPRLAAYAYTLTRDRDTCHDVAQESLTRVFDRWDRVDDPTAYTYRIATNLVRAAWRRQGHDRARLAALAHQEITSQYPTTDPRLDVDVRGLVDGLPRKYRELVLLHYYADLALPDVAQALGKPLGTVKRQISEARALLATALEGAA